MDQDLQAFLDSLTPEEKKAMDMMRDLVEQSGMLELGFRFSDYFNINKIAAIINNKRKA